MLLALLQAPEIDAATLNMLPDDSREALLQRLLEQKLRSFAMQVRLSNKHLYRWLCVPFGFCPHDCRAALEPHCSQITRHYLLRVPHPFAHSKA